MSFYSFLPVSGQDAGTFGFPTNHSSITLQRLAEGEKEDQSRANIAQIGAIDQRSDVCMEEVSLES
jgi:hypothetical protein